MHVDPAVIHPRELVQDRLEIRLRRRRQQHVLQVERLPVQIGDLVHVEVPVAERLAVSGPHAPDGRTRSVRRRRAPRAAARVEAHPEIGIRLHRRVGDAVSGRTEDVDPPAAENRAEQTDGLLLFLEGTPPRLVGVGDVGLFAERGMAAMIQGLRTDDMGLQGVDHVLPAELPETLGQVADDIELADDALLGQQVREIADGVVRIVGGVVLRVEVEEDLRPFPRLPRVLRLGERLRHRLDRIVRLVVLHVRRLDDRALAVGQPELPAAGGVPVGDDALSGAFEDERPEPVVHLVAGDLDLRPRHELVLALLVQIEMVLGSGPA